MSGCKEILIRLSKAVSIGWTLMDVAYSFNTNKIKHFFTSLPLDQKLSNLSRMICCVSPRRICTLPIQLDKIPKPLWFWHWRGQCLYTCKGSLSCTNVMWWGTGNKWHSILVHHVNLYPVGTEFSSLLKSTVSQPWINTEKQLSMLIQCFVPPWVRSACSINTKQVCFCFSPTLYVLIHYAQRATTLKHHAALKGFNWFQIYQCKQWKIEAGEHTIQNGVKGINVKKQWISAIFDFRLQFRWADLQFSVTPCFTMINGR